MSYSQQGPGQPYDPHQAHDPDQPYGAQPGPPQEPYQQPPGGHPGHRPEQWQYPQPEQYPGQFAGQSQYGQQPYAAQSYGPPPSSGGGGRALLIALGGGTAVLLTVALLFVFGVFGGGDDGPKGAVSKYFNALRAGDLDRVRDAVCDEMLATGELDEDPTPEDTQEMSDYFDNVSWSVTNTTENGDSATVFVEWTYTDPETGETNDGADEITVVKEDGDWKVCDTGESDDPDGN